MNWTKLIAAGSLPVLMAAIGWSIGGGKWWGALFGFLIGAITQSYWSFYLEKKIQELKLKNESAKNLGAFFTQTLYKDFLPSYQKIINSTNSTAIQLKRYVTKPSEEDELKSSFLFLSKLMFFQLKLYRSNGGIILKDLIGEGVLSALEDKINRDFIFTFLSRKEVIELIEEVREETTFSDFVTKIDSSKYKISNFYNKYKCWVDDNADTIKNLVIPLMDCYSEIFLFHLNEIYTDWYGTKIRIGKLNDNCIGLLKQIINESIKNKNLNFKHEKAYKRKIGL